MNPFWSEPDSLHAELDIRTPEDPAVLAGIARRWIEAGVQGAGRRPGAGAARRAGTAHPEPGPAPGGVRRPRHPVGLPRRGSRTSGSRQASLHAWTPQTLGAVPGRRGDEPPPDGGRALPARRARLARRRGARADRRTTGLSGLPGLDPPDRVPDPRPADDAAWEQAAQAWALPSSSEQAAGAPGPARRPASSPTTWARDSRTPVRDWPWTWSPRRCSARTCCGGYSWLTLVRRPALCSGWAA